MEDNLTFVQLEDDLHTFQNIIGPNIFSMEHDPKFEQPQYIFILLVNNCSGSNSLKVRLSNLVSQPGLS